MRGTFKMRTITLSRESMKSTMVLRRATAWELAVWCDEKFGLQRLEEQRTPPPKR
jgi:hypothetical protein